MSSYPLPPISTLSAALASQNVPIAPELMGEGGMPPQQSSPGLPEKRRGSDYDNTAGSYGGFANSNARGESDTTSQHDWRPSGGNGRTVPPWEEGYRDTSFGNPSFSDDPNQQHHEQEQQQQGGNEDDGGNPKPRKRSRVSKPRQSKGDKELDLDGQVEYEDPSQDPKAGPVFVHPPTGAAQACVRCHRIKRKCDNARPRCAGCSKADVPCVFELSPATSTYVHNLKSDNSALSTQIASAHERIAHLESVVSSLQRGDPVNSLDFSFTDDRFYPDRSLESPQADFAALARNILSVRSSSLAGLDGLFENTSSLSPSRPHPPSTQPYPPYQVAREAIETFFNANAISYPFLDKTEFLHDMDELYARNARGHVANASREVEEEWRGKEYFLFMVIAMGTTNSERMGEVEKGTSRIFKDRAIANLPFAVAREDILCVQALILLGIYSIFEPSRTPIWQVVGFAARVATALNLHRRVEDDIPVEVAERRKRVFYSLYNLDRMVATTLSKPLAINDNDIDVELPSPLPTDEPYRGMPRIHYTQHIIKMRRLSGVILNTVYSVSGSQNSLPEAERAAIISDLQGQLDTWLAECPTPPSEEEEKKGMINNPSWFMLHYQHCLTLLYRPSPLYPITTNERLRALHEASARCVDLYVELWQEQKVSYNLININAQFLACISLLYTLVEYDNRSPDLAKQDGWKKEVSNRVGQCHQLLDAFGRALPETAKYREVFGKMSDILLARHGPLPPSSSTAPSAIPHTSAAFEMPATSTLTPVDTTGPMDFSNIVAGQDGGSEEDAWGAMTQLWFNSGGLSFDDALFGQMTRNGGGNGAGTGTGTGSAGNGGDATAKVEGGEVGRIENMLWNQTG